MQLVEKKVKVVVGLNAMARKLGCSRGHLSLVIHGHRKSGRLEKRLQRMGFEHAKQVMRNGVHEAGLEMIHEHGAEKAV